MVGVLVNQGDSKPEGTKNWLKINKEKCLKPTYPYLFAVLTFSNMTKLDLKL